MADEVALPNPILRRIAQGLFWLAVALLGGAIAVAFLPGAPTRLGSLLAGGGLAALGANVLLGGDVIAGPLPRSFTARGQVVRARLEADTGMAALAIGQAEAGHSPENVIATLLCGPLNRPELAIEDDVTTLRMVARRLPPALARWRADLAANVLWDVDVRSSLGNLALDLSGLRLDRVTVESRSGAVRVVCPRRGAARLDIRTEGGGVELVVPEEAGVHVEVMAGPLATVSVNNKRLLAPGQSRYVTPNLETAPTQIEVTIQTESGDIVLI